MTHPSQDFRLSDAKWWQGQAAQAHKRARAATNIFYARAWQVEAAYSAMRAREYYAWWARDPQLVGGGLAEPRVVRRVCFRLPRGDGS